MVAVQTMRIRPAVHAARILRELTILRRFIRVYCHVHHGTRGEALCSDCAGLLTYATQRLERCPHDPKPKCKHCSTHCYSAEQRARIKQVMRFSGMWYVKRGRLDWLVRYFMA
jgi:hypothetical protein